MWTGASNDKIRKINNLSDDLLPTNVVCQIVFFVKLAESTVKLIESILKLQIEVLVGEPGLKCILNVFFEEVEEDNIN